MGIQSEVNFRIQWIHVFYLILMLLMTIICEARSGSLNCFLEVRNSTEQRTTTIKPSKSPRKLNKLLVEETVTIQCLHSSVPTNRRCDFTWKNTNLTGPVLSNFSVSDEGIVLCNVTCGSSHCSISLMLDVIKPTTIPKVISKTSRMTTNTKQNSENMKSVFTRPYPDTISTYKRLIQSRTPLALLSTNQTQTNQNADVNIVVFLCLFGVIIIILSFLAGNISCLAAKCRSIAPNVFVTNGAQDSTPSTDSEVIWQRRCIPSVYEDSSKTTRSPIGPKSAAIKFEQTRAASYCDKDLFSVKTSKMKEVPLPPVPTNSRRRKKSLSNGCIYDRASHFFIASCIENMPIEYYEYSKLPSKSPSSCCVDGLYNAPYDFAKSPYADAIYNDFTTCRARLDSEFTYGRDRFLSNALKMRPSKITRKNRLSSQFSYQRDRFLSNAVRSVAFDGRRRRMDSLNRRRRTRLGTMTSIFSSSHRGTRSYSKLSLSTLEDVFMNEHIYETISLDDLRKISSGDLALDCEQEYLNNFRGRIEKSFSVYDKSEKISSEQTERRGNSNRYREKGKELPPLYITLEQVFDHQRRYSLPSPKETIAMGYNGQSTHVSHGSGILFSSAFRSEGHLPSIAPKLKLFHDR